jgi:hypothetical protein
MSARAVVVTAISLTSACAERAPARPPKVARDLPTLHQPSSRDDLLKAVFAAIVAGDSASLMSLGEPEQEWKTTLECPPPGSIGLQLQRDQFVTLVDKTKGLHVDLINVTEDRVLLDLPTGYDDGYGCKTKVALTFHRLLLELRVTASVVVRRAPGPTPTRAQRASAPRVFAFSKVLCYRGCSVKHPDRHDDHRQPGELQPALDGGCGLVV